MSLYPYLPSEEADAAGVITLIEAEGVKALALSGDVRDEAWNETMGARTVEAFGGLDILVVNAAREPRLRSLLRQQPQTKRCRL